MEPLEFIQLDVLSTEGLTRSGVSRLEFKIRLTRGLTVKRNKKKAVGSDSNSKI